MKLPAFPPTHPLRLFSLVDQQAQADEALIEGITRLRPAFYALPTVAVLRQRGRRVCEARRAWRGNVRRA